MPFAQFKMVVKRNNIQGLFPQWRNGLYKDYSKIKP